MNNKHNLISICIPTWDYYGHGPLLMQKMFSSLENQTNKNFEIIISDQSTSDNIEYFLSQNKHDLMVKYFKFEPYVPYIENLNNAIKESSGEIIKPLFQPDFVLSDNMIQDLFDAHSETKCWCALRHNHCNWDATNFHNERIPYYDANTLVGINRISSPTVISYDSSFREMFDGKLKMLSDCEFYHRLKMEFGEPRILSKECYVTNRESDMEAKYDPTVNNDIPYDINRVIEVYNLKQKTDINIWMSPFSSFIR